MKWQLFGEVGWRDASHAITEIGEWLDGYVGRRYAPAKATPQLLAAWRHLLDGVYGGDKTQSSDFPAEEEAGDTDMQIQMLAAAGSGPGSGLSATVGRTASAHDAAMFSKDGFCRVPSFGFKLWKSHNTTAVVEAWRLLLLANSSISADTTTTAVSAKIAAFSYDLVDVTRQALQDRFAAIYTNMSAHCGMMGGGSGPAPPPVPRPKPGQPVKWVMHNHSNCGGVCVNIHSSGPNGGNCDRMPGCGHDASLPFCDPQAMEARCFNVSSCTCFNTNGYLYVLQPTVWPAHIQRFPF